MLVVSRTLTMAMGQGEATELALEAREVAAKASGLDLGLYMAGPGYPGNTFIFSAMVEDMATYAAAAGKLGESKDYLKISEKAVKHAIGPSENGIRSIVHMTGDAEIAVGDMLSSVTTQVRNGRYADAMAFGVEMTEYYNKGTGLDGAFLRSVAGDMGEVQWLARGSAADFDKAMAWEGSDAGYLERYESAGDLFAQGTGLRGYVIRIG